MWIMGTLNQNIRMVKIKEHNYRRMVEYNVTVNAETLEVERKRTYVEVLSKVVINTVVTNSKPKILIKIKL